MKRITLLVMLLLSLCVTVFAESLEDVLKDCKLDRNRWKVAEWVKSEKYVRFYDSGSVTATGSDQFDLVICDYFYGAGCDVESCKLHKARHFHSEKWNCDAKALTKTIKNFTGMDADLKVVTSFEYPSSVLIPLPIKKNSVDGKTMLAAKELVKDDARKYNNVPAEKSSAGKPVNKNGFAPLPQPIGSKDGEWTYLGRFIGPTNMTYTENILLMRPFESKAECDGVFDVYFYHIHNDRWCYESEIGYGYSCELKLVPLDRNGNIITRRGVCTELVHIGGGTKGAFCCSVSQVRRYDSLTHELIETIDNNSSKSNKLTSVTSYGGRYVVLMDEYSGNNPFIQAMELHRF